MAVNVSIMHVLPQQIKTKNHPACVLYLFHYEAVCLREVAPSWLIRTAFSHQGSKGFLPFSVLYRITTLLPKEQALCVLATLLLQSEFCSSNFAILQFWNSEEKLRSWFHAHLRWFMMLTVECWPSLQPCECRRRPRGRHGLTSTTISQIQPMARPPPWGFKQMLWAKRLHTQCLTTGS